MNVLLQENINYRHIQFNGEKDDDDVIIHLSDFEKKARDNNIDSIIEFLESKELEKNGYNYNSRERVIVHKS